VALAALAIAAFSAVPAAAGPPSGPFSHAGRWRTDSQGRVIDAHGVDVIRKFAPFYPPAFGDADASLLASEGFTQVRLGLIWEAVEPRPGVYDDAYVGRIAALDRLLARHRIATIVDFHQDSFSQKTGGDGAPAWATLGATSADAAFAHFWNDDRAPDGVGVQTHFINAWKHVVPLLRRSKNIVGYDVLNEPYPGSGYPQPCGDFSPCEPFESGPLDRKRLIFYEPIATGQTTLTSLPVPLSSDPRLGFEFHHYCSAYVAQLAVPSFLLDPLETPICAGPEQKGLDNGLAYATAAQTAVDVGEFSANDTNTDNARMVDLMGVRFMPWAVWHYYSKPELGICCVNEGLLVDDSKPASEANAKQAKLDASVVPYAAAVAGTPVTYSYDRASKVMRLVFSTHAVTRKLAKAARTQIFVPARVYPDGYAAEVSGASVVSRPKARWLQLRNHRGAREVSLTVSPLGR
jgi:endoglycosylceramidase